MVPLLLAHPDIDMNFADKDGLTPLFLATQRGSLVVVEILLEKAKEKDILEEVVNARATDGTGISPVFLGAQEGHLEIVERLVDAGAVVDTHFINDEADGENQMDLGKFFLSAKTVIADIYSCYALSSEEKRTYPAVSLSPWIHPFSSVLSSHSIGHREEPFGRGSLLGAKDELGLFPYILPNAFPFLRHVE